MKKLALLLSMSVVVGGLLAGCGETTTETVNSTTEKDKNKETEVEQAEEKAPEVEEVVADSENVKITYRGTIIEDSIMGKEAKIVFDIENKTDSTIIVQERELSIDDTMVDEATTSFSATVAAGKSAKKQSISIYDFEGYDFPEFLDNAEMKLIVIDEETFDRIEEFSVSINFE